MPRSSSTSSVSSTVPAGRATALQPASVEPSALKATLPVGALPETVAVNVTFAPTTTVRFVG